MKTRNFIELKDYMSEEEFNTIKENFAGDTFYISIKDYQFANQKEKVKYIQDLWFSGKSVKFIANELGMSKDRINHLKNIKLESLDEKE